MTYRVKKLKLDKDLIDWIVGKSYKNKAVETQLISKYFDTSSVQWSSQFGEKLVKYLLELQGFNGQTVTTYPVRDNLTLDLETNTILYEVKTRNYSTAGSAGEKILGTPYKYANLQHVKPIHIIVVGYQEYEADKKFNLFNATGNRKILLDIYSNMNIHYVRCSDLLYKSLYSLVLQELISYKKIDMLNALSQLSIS